MASTGGSAPYYIHTGLGGSSGSRSGSLIHIGIAAFHSQPRFRRLSNPQIQLQSNVESNFTGELKNSALPHGTTIDASSGVPPAEPGKKRGRPRKYAPDGQVSLGLSPMSAKPKPSSGADASGRKRNRGRPPGTGRKQQLAALGEWMNSSAGQAFAPHVVTIGIGEMKGTVFVHCLDSSLEGIVGITWDLNCCCGRIFDCAAFVAIVDIIDVTAVIVVHITVHCAMVICLCMNRVGVVDSTASSGTVSSVTLRQPESSTPTVTYEVVAILLLSGQFEILCLSGSYLLAEDGGPHSRTGGISASLSTPDGHVIGGGVATLIALSLVQRGVERRKARSGSFAMATNLWWPELFGSCSAGRK
ncbi:Polynucleotidyl transferase isoform 1 [Hibiscus syriacus]|uniref:AT-hook motif nuclear-localized protein n=1 Tax=Hibiscus syriacus TaxID=106335 RepID=A0A6A3CJH7_HIBSY|nr:Polynucleotidyl transferase isoform 1 [Hibiscus syriacus]